MNPLKYGPSKKIVKFMVWLTWPIIIAGKKWSTLPILKRIINPFFAYPWNEVTVIPINQEMPSPENVVVPRRLVERLVTEVSDVFIMNECICRNQVGCETYPRDIGCIVLGQANSRIHPSHGHRATPEEAVKHVRRAAEAGLVANVAHAWVDPLAFGLTRFKQLMFICFCDDCCCMYRTHMKKRGPNLERAYQGLPGISVEVDPEKCEGCATCVDRCFVGVMELREGTAFPGESCKGCGRCVEVCPQKAALLRIDNEDVLYGQLVERINDVSDILGSS